ncbi:hypothetical protein GCM10010385_28050 [Streptomyces geysiriensis]|nr:hypothetical protein GCM10010385_28050 [Streptomyces geysiriensis]
MPITEAAAAAATIAFLSTSRSFRRSDALSYGLINPVRSDWLRAFTRLARTRSRGPCEIAGKSGGITDPHTFPAVRRLSEREKPGRVHGVDQCAPEDGVFQKGLAK